jgi:hypothetical protein
MKELLRIVLEEGDRVGTTDEAGSFFVHGAIGQGMYKIDMDLKDYQPGQEVEVARVDRLPPPKKDYWDHVQWQKYVPDAQAANIG